MAGASIRSTICSDGTFDVGRPMRNANLSKSNLFLVMTSLVLGLMLNSAKNTLDTNNRNLCSPATDITLLDRIMRGLGPEAEDARRQLLG
jgi:hypothetical protein